MVTLPHLSNRYPLTNSDRVTLRESKGNVQFNDAFNTLYYGYMASDVVTDH